MVGTAIGSAAGVGSLIVGIIYGKKQWDKKHKQKAASMGDRNTISLGNHNTFNLNTPEAAREFARVLGLPVENGQPRRAIEL